MEINKTSVDAATTAVARHGELLGVEGGADVQVWHLLFSLVHYSAANGIDVVDALSDVLKETGASATKGKIPAVAASAVQTAPTPTPRVLVVVRGGVANPVYDPGVEVVVFDWDDYVYRQEGSALPPSHFADLAAHCDIPVDCNVTGAAEAADTACADLDRPHHAGDDKRDRLGDPVTRNDTGEFVGRM